ncbi:MAG: hypothetical protein GY722_05635 [bacterium]|nr:hypothetical protein [bacterium]
MDTSTLSVFSHRALISLAKKLGTALPPRKEDSSNSRANNQECPYQQDEWERRA